MPSVRITKPTMVRGVPVLVGDVIDVSDKDARTLAQIGKAEPAPEKRAKKSADK